MTRLTRAGFTGDVFTELNRKCPDWTRERWDQATREIAEYQAERRKSPITTAGEVMNLSALGRGEEGSLENFLAA